MAWGAALALLATGLNLSEPELAAAAGCAGGAPSDFNGDGTTDVAIADPEASVGGVARAGRLTVVYGNGAGVDTISQDTAGIPGGTERGDRYGFALENFDHNQDGCSDLVVGTPYEALGDAEDAGFVHIIYGAPTGLGDGPAAVSIRQGQGSGAMANYGAEIQDWFGYSVAAGDTSAGQPYLIIGAPGEKLDGFDDTGVAHYIRGSVNVAIHQDTPGVEGVRESDDRFGYEVAASRHHIALGNPGEQVGTDNPFSGGVQLLSHDINANGVPTPLEGITQTTPGIVGGSETGDRFGSALAVIPYGADGPGDSIIAVGMPGEDLPTGEDAGRVVTLRVSDSGQVAQLQDIHQPKDSVAGIGEDGDYFGQHLTAVNRDPGSALSANTALLAVGIPGEDMEGVADTGSIQVFSLTGAVGNNDVTVEPGLSGLPGTAEAQEYLGTSLRATRDHLYIGMPYGPDDDRALHAVPWANITYGAAEPLTTWKPGQGGVPTGGVAFGAAAR